MILKRFLNIALMAAMVCCLSLAVTSCKDDDNESYNGGNPPEHTDGEIAAADRFWAVAANLVSPFDVTDDYADKTFEPTIGEPLNGNDAVRVVNCGSAGVASLRFNDMTGASIDENTETYTYHDDAVGTLTYNKTDDGQSLATVDVNIKQIPGLQRIVYKTQEQMGDNGSFSGTPYYSFGDVVKLTDNGREEYWVCVRPAIGPAGKEDTHWITVSKLPDANIKELTKNGKTYNVPTKLGTSEEHMQNLAEMLYAMFDPQDWRENIDAYSSYGIIGPKGLPIFHDLKPERVQYFDSYFWGEVYAEWHKKDLFQKIFNFSPKKMEEVTKSQSGLHLLGSGYTGTVGLYQWTFNSQGDGDLSNMHKMTKTIVKQTGANLDSCGIDYITQVRNQAQCYWVNQKFFGDSEPRFVFRTATGKQLRGSNPGVFGSLSGGSRQIEDVYTYTSRHLRSGADIPYTPRSRSRTSHYKFGDVYKDENGHRWFVLRTANNAYDLSDYAQLISFDGLDPSDDKRQINNLPTLSQVVRTATILHPFFNQSAAFRFSDDELWVKNKSQPLTYFTNNLLNYCGVDISMLFQLINAQDHNPRESSACVSIAYRDPNDNSGKQRLVRMIKNSQNEKKMPHFYFRTNYPANPDSTTVLYDENAFSQTPIYLQDMADDTFIQKHWNWDSYAIMPIFSWDSRQIKANNPNRNFLTTVNEKANNVTNYYYDREKWQNRTFPTDMWHAPVLMYRVIDVYDYSESLYKTKSENGIRLTLEHSTAGELTDDDGIMAGHTIFESFMKLTYKMWVVERNAYWINGKEAFIYYNDF